MTDGKAVSGFFKGLGWFWGVEAACLLGFGVLWPLAVAQMVGTGYIYQRRSLLSSFVAFNMPNVCCIAFYEHVWDYDSGEITPALQGDHQGYC